MIGVLFATEMEAQPFRNRIDSDSVVVSISGMGLDAARTATLELIEKHTVDRMINAGVCGSLSDKFARGDVFSITDVFNENEESIPAIAKSSQKTAKLVSVDEPVFQPDRKVACSKFADLVDMEGYAVAQVCAEKNIHCTLIKGVTDFGDGDGKEDIQKHIAPVSESVADMLVEIVDEASSLVVLDETGCLDATRLEASSTLVKKLHSFTKIEHTIFSLPLLFAGAWLGAGGMPKVSTLLLIALVGLGARTFGMAANRILDRNIDAKNSRTKNRELPSGKLSMAQGYGVAVAGLVCYFVGCALLGMTVLKLSLLPLIPLALYSLLKRFTPLCHYGIGVCLAAAPLGAFVAMTNSLAFSQDVLLLALFTFCWISGFDIIYAMLDIDFDRKNNVRSIPATFGESGAQLVAAITHMVAMMALAMLWRSVGGNLALVALLTSAGAFGAAYLQHLPVHVRFFPISAIAGIAGAMVVLLGGH